MAEVPVNSNDVNEELTRIHLALLTVFSPGQSAIHHQSTPSNLKWLEQRQLADKYLTNFQSSAVSWMVCDRLLLEQLDPSAGNDQSIVQHRRFFAAQTLHTKCRSDAHQLPPEALQSLRDSLFNHLTNHCRGGDSALMARIAMSIAALSVQMSWTTVIHDLFATMSEDKIVVASLLLKVLPEECASDRLVLIDENVRYAMRDHFVSSAADVFRFLHQSIRPEHKVNVFEIFHIWIRYVPLTADTVLQSPLLERSIKGLNDKEVLEVSVDVVVEILRMFPSHHNPNQALVQRMVPLLTQLPFDQALASDDEDILRAYCRVIIEMGESYMSLVLSVTENASQLVEWVLRCSGISDKEVANMTLHFWYRMVIDLEGVEPYDTRQELVDRYTPHLLQLIDICASSLMKYPDDILEFSTDEYDDVQRERFYVGETLDDCCRLLGGDAVLKRIGTNLRRQCDMAAASNTNNGWHAIESSLNCITCINQFVPSDESAVLPFCFDLISRLPGDIDPLRYTCSKLMGKYASWLAMHSELLQPLLPYLAHGLSLQKCAPAAATAIKELCLCSSERMPMGQPVLHLYNEVTAGVNGLELKDELEILEGMCRAISRETLNLGSETSLSYLQQVVQPIGARLAAHIANTQANPRDIISELERLTVVVRYLNITGNQNTHPVREIMQSSWTLLEASSLRFPSDTNLAEKICRLHKHAIRACGAVGYAPMLDALIHQLNRSYEHSHQSPYLYLASVCVAEYGRTHAYAQKLYEMIGHLANVSFSFLRSLDDLTSHPDVVEELFYLMGRMMSYCPDPLVTSPYLQQLLQCATVGMQLDHRDANKGTLNFLENAVGYGLSLREKAQPACEAALHQALSSEGEAIVKNLALALKGDIPAYSLERGNGSIAGILWKLNMLMPGQTLQWLQQALVAAPEQAKAEFLGALNSGLPRADFGSVIRAFVNACDRHRKFQGRAP